ncbi:MAG TPA: NAD(P)-dependent oxidoreductase [Tahibacter sp.]|uniref:NAD-dependent epimerase/dehydratase family protein n=1 Tax=Tahibacter sp. TaxID=2056211 RepID=UPI002C85EA3A|nr:NAD(P)-dependent oxidoreductase [Tahibacter sp.]HSX60823.1 NAD(P)-dependent oxidoreductase [Tahibacter sp.]
MSAPRHILVTGASGFIGSAFLDRFAAREDLVLHGVGRRPLARPNYHAIDLSQPFDLDVRADVVIHAAARSSPWGTTADFRRHNVEATRRVLDWCRRNGLPRLVYVSSSSVFYRDADQFGLTEDSPIGPAFVNDYAATKYAGEQLVAGYEGSWVVARPRAVFGPGDTVLFPRILRAARRGRLPLIDTGRAPAVGDLIYIETLCDYLLALALREDLRGSYNLTNNAPIAIQTFLLDTFERLGLPAPRRRVSLRLARAAATAGEWLYRTLRLPGEPPITRFGVGVFTQSKTFDATRMLRDLGPPSVSLDEGVARFVDWQRRRC